MIFCVAILILKMEENTHFWHIMLYYFKKGTNATEMQKKICAVYGEGAVTDQTCQKGFVKFRAGDFSLDDAPRSVDQLQLIAIKSRHNGDQRYTTWERADILKISKSIQLLVKMKNVYFILWKKLNRLFGQPNILNFSLGTG